MIREDYVSFEVAKLLREKGFDEPCFRYYECYKNDINGKGAALMFSTDLAQKNFNHITYHLIDKYNDNDDELILCPTHQMAMKWLREMYGLMIVVHPSYPIDGIKYESLIYRLTELKDASVDEYNYDDKEYDNYEQACESAIKYCIENLI